MWAFEILQKLGIDTDCSIFPASRAHGGIPEYSTAYPSVIQHGDISIKSLPINTASILGKKIVYSGGGYFRLLPLWYLRQRFRNDDYIMTYFHPRDFDPDQPMVPGLGIARKFKSYVGLSRAYNKLEFLLRTHSFVDVSSAVTTIDWLKVNRVVLK